MSLNFFIPLALVSVSRNWFTFSSRAFYQYMSLKMGYEHANIFEEEHFNYSQNMWPVEGRHKCGWFIVYIPARITLVVSVYSVNLRYYPVWSWLSLFLNFTSILSTNSWCLQSIILLQTCSYKCLLYNSHNTMTTYAILFVIIIFRMLSWSWAKWRCKKKISIKYWMIPVSVFSFLFYLYIQRPCFWLLFGYVMLNHRREWQGTVCNVWFSRTDYIFIF